MNKIIGERTIQIKVNSPPLAAGWQKFLTSLEAMLTVDT